MSVRIWRKGGVRAPIFRPNRTALPAGPRRIATVQRALSRITCYFAIALLIACVITALAETLHSIDDPGFDHTLLMPGRPAPDLELPLLDEGDTRGAAAFHTKEGFAQLSLSSFRGERTVCLFLSSFT